MCLFPAVCSNTYGCNLWVSTSFCSKFSAVEAFSSFCGARARSRILGSTGERWNRDNLCKIVYQPAPGFAAMLNTSTPRSWNPCAILSFVPIARRNERSVRSCPRVFTPAARQTRRLCTLYCYCSLLLPKPYCWFSSCAFSCVLCYLPLLFLLFFFSAKKNLTWQIKNLFGFNFILCCFFCVTFICLTRRDTVTVFKRVLIRYFWCKM